MSYLVFARKFRPQRFEDVVGQEPITTTLKNAIEQGRITQNFIFSGPRGVGKTTTARILAKALNCTKGPTPKPCDKCTACTEITQGNSLDVLEIDGASNRGIDEIRNLRETVKFKPVSGPFKIYIIDEVHMLTTEAFNALLKTLEEPPPHVKFIFATTEIHKVPLTILSRCQRFQFKRIPTPEIVKKLEEIAKKEKISCEKGALHLIAKSSDGSLRDAESLLDQLTSFAEDKIKEEDALAALGLASWETYSKVLAALKAKDIEKLFRTVKELYEDGRDLAQFGAGLLELFRNLLLFQSTEKAGEFVDLSDEAAAELDKRKNDFSRGELLLGLSLLQNLQQQVRRALAPPKLLIEIALAKLASLDRLSSVEEMMQGANNNEGPGAGGQGPVVSRVLGNVPSVIPEKGFSARHPERAKRVEGSQSRDPSTTLAQNASSAQDDMKKPASSFDQIESSWPRVIEYVKAKRMSTGIFLSEAAPVELSAGSVTLGLPNEFGFHKEMLEKDANRRVIEEAFEVVCGSKLRVQLVITKTEQVRVPEDSEGELPADMPHSLPPVDSSKSSEIITHALNIFDGAKVIRKE